MENDRFARYGAATGIIAVVLILVGFSIFGSDLPDTNASAQDWGAFFTDHQSRIQLGVTIVGVGLFFFIWFLAACEARSRRPRAARAGSHRSPSGAGWSGWCRS